MGNKISPLDKLQITAPCPAKWDEMSSFQGEPERVRYCVHCELNVYNLSALSRQDAEALLLRMEGRLCVRLYRRADGTILTQNCPIGLAKVKARMSQLVQVAMGMLIGLLANIGFWSVKNAISPSPYVVGEIRLSKEEIDSIVTSPDSDGWNTGVVYRPSEAERAAIKADEEAVRQLKLSKRKNKIK